MKFSKVALLSAATLVAAQPQHAHNHARRHHKRGSPVQGRDITTTTEIGAVVTVYQLDGIDVPLDEVEAGLKDGKYVLVTPIEKSTSTPTPTPSTSSSASPIVAFQKDTSSSSSSTPTPSTSAAPPPSSTSAAAPVASTPAASSSSGGTGLDSDFPSGTIKCSDFASVANYGPVSAPWLGLGGWTGVQNTPSFTSLTAAKVISYIETAISGSDCTPYSFCSYACPAGYQKSQWPTAQGATGQSIGGLYCNGDGYLELSNTASPQLCITGTGGVFAKNTLSENVCVCRTDYPGTESETVALNVLPGATDPLTCPDANTYYQWEGSHTSAQYYINNKGLSEADACAWLNSTSNAGNWAPVNAGVGRGTDGVTYISLFPNKPTNPTGILDFTVTITGGTAACSYSNGKYYGNNGVESDTGCTVGLAAGEEAYFVFS